MKFKFEFPAKEAITDAHLKTLNCYEYFQHLLGTLLSKYKDEDPKICILPWKLGASNTPISVPSKIPKNKDLLGPYVSLDSPTQHGKHQSGFTVIWDITPKDLDLLPFLTTRAPTVNGSRRMDMSQLSLLYTTLMMKLTLASFVTQDSLLTLIVSYQSSMTPTVAKRLSIRTSLAYTELALR
jgi:hypothetical protein